MPASAESGRDRPAHGWWQCLALGSDGSPSWFAVVWSQDRPDGARIELPEDEARGVVGLNAVCVAHYDTDAAVRSLEVTARGAPKAPPLWFAELPEPDATPPAAVLVTFSGHGVDAGAIVDRVALREVDVKSADQLGAVRWYPATGEVDQIYVSPDHRRRSIGSALIAASSALTLARGCPRLWGDGQRTALGDRWRNASPWSHRAAELTNLAPPMTPFDQR